MTTTASHPPAPTCAQPRLLSPRILACFTTATALVFFLPPGSVGHMPMQSGQGSPIKCCQYNERDRELHSSIWSIEASFSFPPLRVVTVVLARNFTITPKQGDCLTQASECTLARKDCGVKVSLEAIVNAPNSISNTYVFWGGGYLVSGTLQPRVTQTAGPTAHWQTLSCDVTAYCHGDGVSPPPRVWISAVPWPAPGVFGADLVDIEFTCSPACDY